MNAKCSICFEVLSEDVPPVATRCGHLYCNDCATFNFGRPGARCAVCRTPHLREDLIKLYMDYEKQEVSYEVAKQPRSSTSREQSFNAGHCVMKGADTWDVRTLVDVAVDRYFHLNASYN
ncbi:hypothetical protein DAEQUDRAFT_724407 [Daedalea quercina L-15889]|uniref:RING-type domain-containing protein n=1 Tax=Daedalea quercina L-15889 TaxID=1314783 RepID=A0A165S1Q7_9APHY|nr:hypothetical protein DAEQUDRAFT_724407 [Daedalea quercina L-15889]